MVSLSVDLQEVKEQQSIKLSMSKRGSAYRQQSSQGQKPTWTRLPELLTGHCDSAGKESACNVGDLGWEDPLETGMAIHSSILAWGIQEEPGGL